MKAMILAAGLGTRLQPLTEHTPKALIPINGKPMIEHGIEKLIATGVDEIVVNAHHHAPQMREYFGGHSFKVRIHLLYEAEILGTGGGIYNARSLLAGNEPFIVHNADVYSDVDFQAMIAQHAMHGAFASLAVNKRDTLRPIFLDEQGKFLGKVEWFSAEELKEHRDKHQVGFCGIHILSPEIFKHMNASMFDIFEAYRICILQNLFIDTFDLGESFWIDLGTKERIERCEEYLQESVRGEN